ncbi:EamA family transporter [Nocardia sp. NPDC005366]|uniref:EamA family transporter n=1 Tax=Nocardia sp. NPDC005366 TaxID=3156878 RepID=UPI0033AA6A6E
MTIRDRLLGLTVVLLWGLNFLAIRIGLDHLPPFFFAALRFAVIAVPVLLFVPRPRVPWRWILLYGTGFGILQFTFLYTAMRTGMPTGLASLVLQSSAPFTVLLGAVFLREHIRPLQVAGIGVAMTGMAVIGWDRLEHAALLPVLLTLAGGLGWAFGNVGARLAGSTSPGFDPLHLTLWMAVIPPAPLMLLSACTEGPTTGLRDLAASFSHTGWPALVALAYIAILASIVGSGLWTYLMGRYPAGTVAPFSLLVPVVGIAAAWAFLHETPTVMSLLGGAVVIAGAFTATSASVPVPKPISAASAPPHAGIDTQATSHSVGAVSSEGRTAEICGEGALLAAARR